MEMGSTSCLQILVELNGNINPPQSGLSMWSFTVNSLLSSLQHIIPHNNNQQLITITTRNNAPQPNHPSTSRKTHPSPNTYPTNYKTTPIPKIPLLRLRLQPLPSPNENPLPHKSYPLRYPTSNRSPPTLALANLRSGLRKHPATTRSARCKPRLRDRT